MSNRKKQVILICITVGITLVALISTMYIYTEKTGISTARIYQNNVLIETVDLTQAENRVFTVYGENGAYNTIEIKDGAIGIIASSCANQNCVHCGFIKNSMLPIVCLPNHIIIETEELDDEYDSKAY